MNQTKVRRLRDLVSGPDCVIMPCCGDALGAKLIEQAGFPLTFMSGFAVSAQRLGAPDLGLISFGEMLDQGRYICNATNIPVIGDGDTGYGNAMNVMRTVREYAQAGFAAIMIEDQVSPKRCGHTKGKQVVSRAEAIERIVAAGAARDELRKSGGDILIMARTDARATHDLDEAIWRANAFRETGADLLFVEAPQDENELARIPAEAPGIHMANMLEGGLTPLLPADQLADLGYRLAAYPLTLLSASMQAMLDVLAQMAQGRQPDTAMTGFDDLRQKIGFDDYYARDSLISTRERG